MSSSNAPTDWWTAAQTIARRHARSIPAVEAPDLAQDLAVLRLTRAPATGRIAAWLERVGRNLAVDGWRRRRRETALPPTMERVLPAGHDPESLLLAREREAEVARALEALPESQRQAVVLHYFDELAPSEIAARMNTAPATARTRLHRSAARLRDRLSGLRALFIPLQAQPALVAAFVILAAAAAPPPRSLAITADLARAPAATARARAVARTIPRLAQHTPAPAPSRARPPEPRPSFEEPASPPAVQVFRFGDDLIDGTVLGPDDELYRVPPPIEHSSLIELRENLIPELLKTMEEI